MKKNHIILSFLIITNACMAAPKIIISVSQSDQSDILKNEPKVFEDLTFFNGSKINTIIRFVTTLID